MNTTAIPTQTVFKIMIPKFGSLGTLEYLNFLAHCKGTLVPVGKYGNQRCWQNDYLTYKFKPGSMAKQFQCSLNKIFCCTYLKVSVAEEPLYDSQMEYLLSLIRNFDWTYEMSDDHRYWVAGEQAKATVLALMNECRGCINFTGRVREACKAGGNWNGWVLDKVDDLSC
jgi:hypothetical protein